MTRKLTPVTKRCKRPRPRRITREHRSRQTLTPQRRVRVGDSRKVGVHAETTGLYESPENAASREEPARSAPTKTAMHGVFWSFLNGNSDPVRPFLEEKRQIQLRLIVVDQIDSFCRDAPTALRVRRQPVVVSAREVARVSSAQFQHLEFRLNQVPIT